MAKKMFNQLRYALGLLHTNLSGDGGNMSDTPKHNTQLSAMDLIKYDRCSLRARYCREIYECFPNG
jgi:hypothetical protein